MGAQTDTRDYSSDASIETCWGEGQTDQYGSRAGYGADVAVTNSGNDSADYDVTVVFERGSEQLDVMTAEIRGVEPGTYATTNVASQKYMTTFECRITSVERIGTGDGETDDIASTPTCEEEERIIRTAFEAHFATNGSYPTSLDDIVGTLLQHDPQHWTFSGEFDDEGAPVLDPIDGC